MADFSITCNGCEAGENGQLYTVPVYCDGESYFSYVFEESDVSGQTAENVRTMLYEQPVWFTDLWRSPDGTLFVTDEDGCVHVGEHGGWRSERVAQAFSPPLGSTIRSIRGTSPCDLYTCGEDSLFWHFDGTDWSPIALPTGASLVGLLCLSETDTIVCGAEGALFRGQGHDWRDLSIPGKSFYQIALWRGRILIAGGSDGVLEFDGAAVTAIKDNIAVYKIAGIEPFLTVAGDNLAARHDGTGWFGARYA